MINSNEKESGIGNAVNITSIDDTALGNHFIEFMRDEGQADKDNLQQWMTEEFESNQERILSAFVLSATGCWKNPPTHADFAKDVVETLETVHEIRDRDKYESVLNIITTSFEENENEYDSRETWIHNHRKRYLFTKGDPANMAKAVVDSIESLSERLGTSDDIARYFTNKYTTSPDPFWDLFQELHSPIDGFRRLSTFDFLELAYRAGQINGLYPRVPRYDYISSENPQPGFNLVIFGDKDPAEASDVEEQQKDALTRLLVDNAIERCDWDHDTAMYDVESCLCNFAKDKNKDYRNDPPGISSGGGGHGNC
jgi:hypothetical protein